MRAWRSIASIAFMLATVAIAGCGGGGGGGNPPPPPVQQPLTGVFVAGRVQGLHFRTPTREGLTDAEGRFTFLPGETVTFSIGGVQLGSATGAAQIDPFDLVGMTPPGTELALRAELTSSNDVTGFDRVANIALLLVSLDVDKDPETGIDLTGSDAALTGASLSLDVPLTLFALERFESFKRAHGVNRSVPVELPLVHLYRTLGITVAVQARESTTVIEGGREIVTTFEYDEQGRPLRDVLQAGENRYAYDRDGRFMSIARERVGNNGSQPSLGLTTIEYDAAGKPVNESFAFERADGAGNFRTDLHYSYDASGVLLSEQFDNDEDGDGSTESRSTTAHTYDGTGNEVSLRVERDTNFDGTPDRVELSSYTYDVSGNRVTQTDRGDDGEEVVVASSYDSSGNLLTSRSELFVGGSLRNREQTTLTYDTAVRLASTSRELDQGANGSIEESSSRVRAYDAFGNVTSETVESVDEAGSKERSTRSHTYGPTGALLSTRSETNGVLTREQTFSYVELADCVGYLIRECLELGVATVN